MAAIMLALATATTVVALNATVNGTGNLSGAVPVQLNKHFFRTVEVWANTTLQLDGSRLLLQMDNGTGLANATLRVNISQGNLTLNETILLTGAGGYADLSLGPGNYSISALFPGGEFIMPAAEEFNLTVAPAESNITLQNQTAPVNGTGSINQTEVLNQTKAEPAEEQPSVAVSLQVPGKVTRGLPFTLVGNVTNNGTVSLQNVSARWNLPAGFNSTSTECGYLGEGDGCVSTVAVTCPGNCGLGTNSGNFTVNTSENFTYSTIFQFDVWSQTFPQLLSTDGEIDLALKWKNGSGLAGQEMSLLQNDTTLETNRTAAGGQVTFPPSYGKIQAYYGGNDSIFAGSSSLSFFVEIRPERENKTVSRPQPTKASIKRIHYPTTVEEGSDFQINVSVASHGGPSKDLRLNFSSSRINAVGQNSIVQVGGQETLQVTWTGRADSCGKDVMVFTLANQSGIIESEELPLLVSCRPFSTSIGREKGLKKLRVKLLNASDGYFWERDLETYERVQTRYVSVFLSASNTLVRESSDYNFEDKVTINSVKLLDEQGREYEQVPVESVPILRNLQDRDFGKGGDIHPQALKEGYVVFQGVRMSSSEFTLVLNTDSGDLSFKFEKVVAGG